MNDLQKNLVQQVMLVSKTTQIITDEEISQYVNILRKWPGYTSLEEKDISEVKTEIKYLLKITPSKPIEPIACEYKKWFLERKNTLSMPFWNRYKEYLVSQDYVPAVIANMDAVSDTMTDLLGDPLVEGGFSRKGLIIGDVQSGKTSNYISLICKAADAGYKIIILLAGTTEILRTQTQKRVDEGFVGWTKDPETYKNKAVGVYNFSPSIKQGNEPLAATSRIKDFAISSTNDAFGNLSIDQTKDSVPVIFVVKKNVSVLTNMFEWLKGSVQEGKKTLDFPLLLIDDEADNASVNTNKEEVDPTKINDNIRNILALFDKSSYVGFTATPFANIFIAPPTKEAMEKEDLFPKDYIYCLEPPSNYIGAKRIYWDDGDYKNILVDINDDKNNPKSIAHYFPKFIDGDAMTELPEDLKKAVETFVLANVIEDLDGVRLKNHRTMLVNVAYKIKQIGYIAELIENYLNNLKQAIGSYSALPVDVALEDEYLSRLKDTYENIYQNIEEEWQVGYSWEEIQKHLNSVAKIEVKAIRIGENFNYEDPEYKDKGARVIIVGGYKMSRGFTLEGLVVTFFYRNTQMYDSLMQMGRWFGYRPHYEKICRVFMSWLHQQRFNYVSEASEELRNEVKLHQGTGNIETPMEFGLRVRTYSGSKMIVTARNKMKTAETRDELISLSGDFVGTVAISYKDEVNEANCRAVRNLVDTLEQNGCRHMADYPNQCGKHGYKDVPLDYVRDFLRNIDVLKVNGCFDPDFLRQYLAEYSGEELKKWDIAFVSGSSDQIIDFGAGINYNLRTTQYSANTDNGFIKVAGGKRIANPEDGKLGLTVDEVLRIEEMARQQGVTSHSLKMYFDNELVKRNPLLIIFALELGDLVKKASGGEDLRGKQVIGFGIGVPMLKDRETKYATYVVNKIWLDMEETDDYAEEDDEDNEK